MEEMIKVIVKEPGKDPEDKMVKNEPPCFAGDCWRID